MSGMRISGWGTALPEKIVTNDDLAKTLDTSDSWITERTGIKERRMGSTTSDLGAEAAEKAIKQAGVDKSDIDLVIHSSSSPERLIPATACTVQQKLGLDKCGSFDINAACAGFVYGLVLSKSMLKSGYNNILLLGAETLTRFMDKEDRSTAVLFGDAAGAVVVQNDREEDNLLSWTLGADGSLEEILFCEHGDYIKMEGKEVFRQAVKAIEESTLSTLEKAGLTADDVDIFIPHQANARIIASANNRLGIPMEKTIDVLSWSGNTSTASIPLGLAEALDTSRINPGDIVLMVGFGAGMTYASALLRWDP